MQFATNRPFVLVHIQIYIYMQCCIVQPKRGKLFIKRKIFFKIFFNIGWCCRCIQRTEGWSWTTPPTNTSSESGGSGIAHSTALNIPRRPLSFIYPFLSGDFAIFIKKSFLVWSGVYIMKNTMVVVGVNGR